MAKCICGCESVIESEKAPICCGRKMEKVSDSDMAKGCCCSC